MNVCLLENKVHPIKNSMWVEIAHVLGYSMTFQHIFYSNGNTIKWPLKDQNLAGWPIVDVFWNQVT